MNYTETIRLIEFLNTRMRPLRWYLWPNLTHDKLKKWARFLGYEESK